MTESERPFITGFDEDGKPTDMAFDSVLSPDGCNPVNKDEEIKMAQGLDEPDIPEILPGIAGTYPPLYFPGAGGPPTL